MRDIRARYQQTVLGLLWTFLQPVLSTVLLVFCFHNVLGLNSGKVPFSLFSYPSVLVWIFFSKAVLGGSQCIVGNRKLITRIYFPRAILPLSAVVGHLFDFGIGMVTTLIAIAACGLPLAGNLLWQLPLLFLHITLLALAVSYALAAVHVRFRDVGYATSFALQLGMYATPVAFPLSAVPARWQTLIVLNPLTGILETLRSALFQLPWNFAVFAQSLAVTATLFLSSFLFFHWQERDFADLA